MTTSQKVKSGNPKRVRKHGLRTSPTLRRETFKTSREMDFFSQKELTTQTGHDPSEWPLVFIKEMIDNSLDACDEHEIAPVIDVVADAAGIEVRDNGPGLPESTLAAALDFKVRASNREAYVAPDRGAQGNALKTILPMPSVIDAAGRLVVEAHNKRHAIRCRVDEISQRPVIDDQQNEVETAGTLIRMEWPIREIDGMPAWPFERCRLWRTEEEPSWIAFKKTIGEQAVELMRGFALFNPHLTLKCKWFGDQFEWQATDIDWQKWKPWWPTSAHWYGLPHLKRLMAAYITNDRDNGRDRLVSDLIAEFDGLTGSRKRTQVLDACGLKRTKLSEFVVDDRIDEGRLGPLLEAMKANSRPVKPARLGVIGEKHFRIRFEELGCDMQSFRYAKKVKKGELPYVLESAFAWYGKNAPADRRVIAGGANWSSAIKNPFRSLGSSGEGLEGKLRQQHVGNGEPVSFALHVAHPRVEYTDRGKSSLVVRDGNTEGKE